MNSVFEVELYREDETGTCVLLDLPVTECVIADAFVQLQLNCNEKSYQCDLLSSKLKYLEAVVPEDANIYEMNHLAQRLKSLSEWELNCFEGMVMMNAGQKGNTPISIEQMINMTHATQTCQILFKVHDDMSLGKFYVDSGMTDIPVEPPESVYKTLDFEKIGRKCREAEGGVFTKMGYIVQSGEIAQVYQSEDTAQREKPDYTVVLHIGSGEYDDIEGNHHDKELKLPFESTCQQNTELPGQKYATGTFTMKAVDCVVPELTKRINDALQKSEGESYGMVYELAQQLKRLDDEGQLTTYKAMIACAPSDLSLAEALELTNHTADFSVQRGVVTIAQYAEVVLASCNIPLIKELYHLTDAYLYGEKLLRHEKAIITDYGVLHPLKGLTVEEYLGNPNHCEGISLQ